eukprot:412378_1
MDGLISCPRIYKHSDAVPMTLISSDSEPFFILHPNTCMVVSGATTFKRHTSTKVIDYSWHPYRQSNRWWQAFKFVDINIARYSRLMTENRLNACTLFSGYSYTFCGNRLLFENS